MDMDRSKNASDSQDATGHKASWVASRFLLIEGSGPSKRRCKHAGCTKEYARGTSHMILKRHWSKQHGTNDVDLVKSYKSKRGNNPHLSSQDDGSYKSPKKKPLKANNLGGFSSGAVRSKPGLQNTNSGNLDKRLGDCKQELDVKLVSKRLKEALSIHLTFDIHNQKKGGKSYGIITAHSLNESLETKSVLLEYKNLPYPDDSPSIYEFLRSCITKFNIKEKIISIASNCSEPIVLAIQEMDKRLRLSKNFGFQTIYIKCFPQFIHVNIMGVLRTQEALIDSVRKVVTYINSNNVVLRPMISDNSSETMMNRAEPINESSVISIDQGSRATEIRLLGDSRGSWNTTYNMIDNFLQQRGVIEPTLLYFGNPQDLTNVNIDWDKLYTLQTLLKPFYSTIDYFVSHNCVPISLVSAILPSLINHLASNSWAYDDLVMAAHNFKSQLESYRSMFHNDLTVVASLLDPRIKDTFMPQENREGIVDVLRKRVEMLPMAREKHEHQRKKSRFDDIFRPFNNDEVTDYMSMNREPEVMEVLKYWTCYRNCYPALWVLARTVCCMQATSVPGDRMFSAGEHLEREKKQNECTNSKVLMKSWAKYLER